MNAKNSNAANKDAAQPASIADEDNDASFARRLKAAGLDGEDDLPDDMDERRILLTRHMAMYRNQWHGCPERLCRRNRGCMAPEGVCANAAEEVEMSEEEWAQARFEIRQALRERILELGMEDECGGL